MFDGITLYLTATAGEVEVGADWMRIFVPMIAIMLLFFWMTHRSQKKKDQERKEMLDGIKVGDDIVSIGGIHGRVTKVNEEDLEVRINAEKDVKIKFNKAAVSKRKADKGEIADN